MKRITLIDQLGQREFVLPQGLGRKLIVGTQEDCDIKIPKNTQTSTVASQHCIIDRAKDDKSYVYSTGAAYNGTYLNEIFIDSERRDYFELKNNDQLRLGDYLLKVDIVEEMKK